MRKTMMLASAARLSLGAMTPAERAKGRYMRDGEGHPKPKSAIEMKTWIEGVEKKLEQHGVDAGAITEIKERVTELEQKAVRRSGPTDDQSESLGAQVARHEGLKTFATERARRPSTFKMEAKAITSGATSGGPLAGQPYRDAPAPLAQRPLTVRSLLTVIPITSGSVEVPVQTSRSSSAGMVAEGTLKPESSYAWNMVTHPVRKIAHFVTASSEILDDAPQLAGTIDTELRYGLDYVEDLQLLKGDGTGQNLAGMIPLATDYVAPFVIPGATMIDTIGLSLLQATLANYLPDGVVVHPSDWMKMRLLKNADGEYLLGDPAANVEPRLFGVRVVPSQAQTVGEFLTGQFALAGTIYDRMTTEVLISTEDGDNFRRNLVTILAEKRLAFAVKQRAALVSGEFA